MTDDDTPKKEDPPQLVGWTKSYTLDGDTTEFNPRELQIHEFSPEMRAQMSHVKLPRLDPKYFEDTAPPNGSKLAASSEPDSSPTAATPIAAELAAETAPPKHAWARDHWHLGVFALLVVGGAVYLWLREGEPARNARVTHQSVNAATTSKPQPAVAPDTRPTSNERVPSSPSAAAAPSAIDTGDQRHTAPIAPTSSAATSSKATAAVLPTSSPARAPRHPEQTELAPAPPASPDSAERATSSSAAAPKPASPRKKRWIELSDE